MNELLETTKIETLKRIADALEGIDQSLSSISNSLVDMASTHPLDDCISKTKSGSVLCVTGNITNYGY